MSRREGSPKSVIGCTRSSQRRTKSSCDTSPRLSGTRTHASRWRGEPASWSRGSSTGRPTRIDSRRSSMRRLVKFGRRQRMKVEIITPNADPDRGGFGSRVHGIVSMFSQFADVRVVVTDPVNGNRVPGVEYVEVPLSNSLRTRIGRMRRYYRRDFPARKSSPPPDLVVVESLDLIGLHQYGPRVPMVLDEHNVYWNLLDYEMENAPFFQGWLGRRSAIRRVMKPRLLERAKRYEIEAIRRSARTLVAECPDAEGRVRVLPNCADLQRIPALPDPGNSRTVAFIGDFNYIPNREAAEFVFHTLAPG